MKSNKRPRKLLPGVLLVVLPPMIVVLVAMAIIASSIITTTTMNELRSHLNGTITQSARAVRLKLDTVMDAATALAANDLIINSLVDVAARENYIPTLSKSIRMPGSPNARVTLADYRGRQITNRPGGSFTGASWIAEVSTGRSVFRVSSHGISLIAPIMYSGRQEGMIVVQYDAAGAAQLVNPPAAEHAVVIKTNLGEIIYASDEGLGKEQLAGSEGREWFVEERIIPGFPSLSLVVGERRQTAFAASDRQSLYLALFLVLSLIAVAGGIIATGFLVTRPVKRFIEEVERTGAAADMKRRMEPFGSAEFYKLSESFNHMMAQLEGATTSRDFVDGIFNSISEPLFVLGGDGQIEIGNRAALDVLGTGTAELSGRNIASVLSGAPEPMRDMKEGKGDSFELTLITHDDKKIPVRASSARMSLASDKEEKTILLLRDISERKKSEAALASNLMDLERSNTELAALSDELAQERDKAEEASRVKSNFLATMSHEIRTPMNGVMGLTDLLLDTNLNDEQQDLALKSKESAESLLSLINDILDLTKLEAGGIVIDNTDFDMENIVGRVIALLDARASEKCIEIRNEIQSGLPKWLIADANRICQILFNLIGNAIKFTEKGVIKVSTTYDVLPNGDIELSCKVRDSGIGIPEDVQESIFSRFTQADSSISRKYGGTGLGLPICKELVGLMGGISALQAWSAKAVRSGSPCAADWGDRSIQLYPMQTWQLIRNPNCRRSEFSSPKITK